MSREFLQASLATLGVGGVTAGLIYPIPRSNPEFDIVPGFAALTLGRVIGKDASVTDRVLGIGGMAISGFILNVGEAHKQGGSLSFALVASIPLIAATGISAATKLFRKPKLQ